MSMIEKLFAREAVGVASCGLDWRIAEIIFYIFAQACVLVARLQVGENCTLKYFCCVSWSSGGIYVILNVGVGR